MQTQWTRLSFYIALGLTALAILFPPFSVMSGPDEYGFLLSGPPSVNAAVAQAHALMGADAGMMTSRIHYTIDFVRLIVELAVIWGAYIALKRTVLKPAVS